jgi:hypothetical protein
MHVVGDIMIPELLYADDVTMTSLTVQGLEKAINQVDKYCSGQGLKVHIDT